MFINPVTKPILETKNNSVFTGLYNRTRNILRTNPTASTTATFPTWTSSGGPDD